MKEFFGTEFGPKQNKTSPKLVFLSFSQVWFISFPLNYIG